jgi:transcriptional regulator with XRE-family HTH domain
MIRDVRPHPESGRRVLLGRLKAGLTQKQLAQKSGLDQSTIIRVERGDRGIRPMTLAKLAGALGVPVEDLLED